MGPEIHILLRHSLTEEQLAGLEQWLLALTSPTRKNRRNWSPLRGTRGNWETFSVKNSSMLGLPSVDWSRLCPFRLTLEKTLTEQDCSSEEAKEAVLEEHIQLVEYLGYIPEQSILLFTFCHRPPHYRVLGQVALHLAEHYDGMIQLYDTLYPPLKLHQRREEVKIEEIKQYIETLSLPGHVYHISSDELTGARRVTIRHLADPEWFRAWLHRWLGEPQPG